MCRPDGEGLHEGECESDIDDRPEDLLYIGQTGKHTKTIRGSRPEANITADSDFADYHLVMRSHTGDVIQDLLYTRMVPNAVHRDLADYWSKNGHVKGEVFVRPGRKYGGYTGSFNAAGTRQRSEYQDRYRVEMLYDGAVAGILQEQGLKWVTDLGSVGVSVFDVLLPAGPGSKPILLPQPPAYLPTLFPDSQNNLQLMGLPPSALVHQLPVAQGEDESIEEQGFFIMSSANHPLVGYAPRAQKGSLLGGHVVQEAVSERLPPLIDPVINDDVKSEEGARQLPEKKSTDEWEDTQETSGGWDVRWKRGPDWLSLGLLGLLAIILLWIMTSARRQPADSTLGSRDLAVINEAQLREKLIAFDKALPAIPTDDEESLSALDSSITPPAEHGDHQASNKKSNGRRRKRGKKNRGKRDGNEEDNEDGDLTEVEPLGDEGGQGEMVVDAPKSSKNAEDVVKGSNVTTQVDGLLVTDDVIGENAPSAWTAQVAVLMSAAATLGWGSHGTVVLSGTFQGRAVAVKRLLRDFVSIASQEVALLQASDDHSNVIRCEWPPCICAAAHLLTHSLSLDFYQEKRDNFLFIALELCSASLADIVENPSAHQDLVVGFDRKKSIYQITSGLKHLHSLKIIHRDLKPQ